MSEMDEQTLFTEKSIQNLDYFEHMKFMNYAIVKTLWNKEWVDKLADGIITNLEHYINNDSFKFNQNPHNKVFSVPGALELPHMVQKLAAQEFTIPDHQDTSNVIKRWQALQERRLENNLIDTLPKNKSLAKLRYLPAKRFDLIFCIGVVIRGETAHFDYICNSLANSMASLSVNSEVPVIFGILTCDNEEQVKARINKGSEFVGSAFHLLNSLLTANDFTFDRSKYDRETNPKYNS